MKKRTVNFIIFLLLVAFIIAWSVFLYFFSPEQIVSTVGVRNGYILCFLAGLLGEAATFTALSYYPTIMTLAAGGLNPIAVGILGGIGMTIGNSLYFIIGAEGRVVLTRRLEEQARRLVIWIRKQPGWAVQLLMFLYVGFTPFPNNLLTASGGITGMSYRRIFLPLLLGNIVLTSSLAYVASLGFF